jgi:hypothetical protein
MERLWIREARRAARRATAPFAWQIALSCGAAAVGTMAATLLPRLSSGAVDKLCGPLCGQWLAMLPSGAGSSFITCGGIELANFTTTIGLRDTMTPILAVLCYSSLVAGQAVGLIPQLIWSYA